MNLTKSSRVSSSSPDSLDGVEVLLGGCRFGSRASRMRAMIPLDPSSPLLVTVSSGISSSLLLAGVGVTEIMYLEILENREELEIGVLLPASSVLSLDDVDLLDSDDLGGVGEVLGLPIKLLDLQRSDSS